MEPVLESTAISTEIEGVDTWLGGFRDLGGISLEKALMSEIYVAF
jgi:hypothetical protein